MLRYINILILLLCQISCATHYNRGLLPKGKNSDIPASYSYIFGSIDALSPRVKFQEDLYITPASCQKIITGLLAFKELGTYYQYRTIILANKHQAVLRFTGDPTLTSERVKDLLSVLTKNPQIKELVLDLSLWKVPSYSENIIIHDMGTSYNPPVHVANIDHNLVELKLDKNHGKQYPLITSNMGYQIANNLTWGQSNNVAISWQAGNVIKLSGTIDSDNPKTTFIVSTKDAHDYITKKISIILQELNLKIKLRTATNRHEIPQNMYILAESFSEPLSSFLKPAMKTSDNLVFDSLYVTILKRHLGDDLVSYSQGKAIIKKLAMNHYAIDLKGSIILDGSGVSRYNKLQTIHLYQFLQQGYKIPEFIESLASMKDINSTVKNRSLPQNVKVKSGSLLGHKCLCGYIKKINKDAVFVISTSAFPYGSDSQIIESIDEMVRSY